MNIPHPLHQEKSRWLSLLQQYEVHTGQKITTYEIGALFPEIYYLFGWESFVDKIIKQFYPAQHIHQDQSSTILRKGRLQLEQIERSLNINPNYWTQKSIVFEDSTRVVKMSQFLCAHYYYHSMFSWFWALYPYSKPEDKPILYYYAGDLSFYQGKPMSEVRRFFELSLSRLNDPIILQKMWTRLGVLHVLRNELDLGRKALEHSIERLSHVPEGSHSIRLAEICNARALIAYREKNFITAKLQLDLSLQYLSNCSDQNPEVVRLHQIIRHNYLRIEVGR